MIDAVSVTVIASIVVTAALYGWGLLRLRTRGRSFSPTAIAMFSAGLVALAASLLGPADDLADTSLAWHMLQHLMLMSVVAPLLLLGAPVRLALAALPRVAAMAVTGALNSLPVRIITHPVAAWLGFAAVMYGAHFSPLYEAALEHPAIHAFEHALFLAAGLVFWTPLLAVAPAPHAPAFPVRLLAIFLALPMSALLGFIFFVSQHVIYAHYATQPGALADQARAGTVMWVAGGIPLFVALLASVAAWGERERRLGTATMTATL